MCDRLNAVNTVAVLQSFSLLSAEAAAALKRYSDSETILEGGIRKGALVSKWEGRFHVMQRAI